MNFKECILTPINFEKRTLHLFLPTLALWLIFGLKTAKSIQPIMKETLVGKHFYVILNMLCIIKVIWTTCTSTLLVCIKYGLISGKRYDAVAAVNKKNYYQNRTSRIIFIFCTLSTWKDNLKITSSFYTHWTPLQSPPSGTLISMEEACSQEHFIYAFPHIVENTFNTENGRGRKKESAICYAI